MTATSGPFIDTNVVLRHVLGDVPEQSAAASGLFRAAERGEIDVHTSSTVMFEAVFVLQSFYSVPREAIRDSLLPLFSMGAFHVPQKELFADVFALYVTRRALSFADCAHIVLARSLPSRSIVTFDRAIGRVPGIVRLKPADLVNG